LDRDILGLGRLTRQDEADAWARYRYRVALVRAGKHELAGIEIGDTVSVEEVESPWVRGVWIGEVLRVFDAGDKYVRPIGADLAYRVRPSAEYLAKGLYLTREDQARLIAPAVPDAGRDEGRAAA
jgi:hypothetical protein